MDVLKLFSLGNPHGKGLCCRPRPIGAILSEVNEPFGQKIQIRRARGVGRCGWRKEQPGALTEPARSTGPKERAVEAARARGDELHNVCESIDEKLTQGLDVSAKLQVVDAALGLKAVQAGNLRDQIPDLTYLNFVIPIKLAQP
ncbi:hypothetical protein MMC31_000805 [Peltigera leucophlebia]|nr:hypothetical protein [Peltigera leucophlebia]